MRFKRTFVIATSLSLIFILGIPIVLLGIIRSNGAPVLSTPGLSVRLSQYLGQNKAKTEEDPVFLELSPIHLSQTPDHAFRLVVETLEQMGLKIIDSSSEELKIHAIEETRLFKFIDDFYVEVNSLEQGRSEIGIRSESRVGQGDFGANIGRILRFRKAIKSLARSTDG